MNIPLPQKIVKLQRTLKQLQPIYTMFEKNIPLPQSINSVSQWYLDSQKKLSVVQAGHLGKVEEINQSLTQQNIRLKEEVSALSIKKQVERTLVQRWKNKSNQLAETCEKLNQLVIKQQKDYSQLEIQYKKLNSKKLEQFSCSVGNISQTPIFLSSPLKTNSSFAVQTEYWIPKIQINRLEVLQSSEPSKNQQNKSQQMVKITVDKLENYFSQLSDDINSTLSNIKDQHISLKDILQKNEQLNMQNKRLRDEVEQFSLDKQKFRIWKENVDARMYELLKLADTAPVTIGIQGIYDNYEPKSQIESEQESKCMRVEIRKLRDGIIRLQLELNAQKLRNKMSEEQAKIHLNSQASNEVEPGQIQQQQSFDKTLKSLSQLSQKLKTVASYLLAP